MIYFSQFINQYVWDGYGRKVGKLEDILIDRTEKNLPPIVALSLKKNPAEVDTIPATQIA